MSRLGTIRDVLQNRKYLAIAVLFSLLYIGLYFVQINYTAGSLPAFLNMVAEWYAVSSVSFAFLIAVLTGLATALFGARFRDYRKFKSATAGSAGGIMAGVFAAGCPACTVGLFPLVMSAFGISATLGSLPFGGIELQVLSVALLSASVYALSKPRICN